MPILQAKARARASHWIAAARNVELADGKHSIEGFDSCFQRVSIWLQLQVTQEVSQAVHVFSHPPWKRQTGLRLSFYPRRRDDRSVQLASVGSSRKQSSQQDSSAVESRVAAGGDMGVCSGDSFGAGLGRLKGGGHKGPLPA